MCHLKGKGEFGVSKGSASQASAAAGSASRRETMHMKPFQDTSRPESTHDAADMSHLDTHTPTLQSCGISVTSSFAESDFQSALVESRRGITELNYIVTKKLTDDKADNPRLGFCDFLKVGVVQLTSNSSDEFQQEIFNLLMRLKRSDQQQNVPPRKASLTSFSHHYHPWCYLCCVHKSLTFQTFPLPKPRHPQGILGNFHIWNRGLYQ